MTGQRTGERQILVEETTTLHFTREGKQVLECDGTLYAQRNPNGLIKIECDLHCRPLDGQRLMDAYDLQLEATGSVEVKANGVGFTHIGFDSTCDVQSLEGTAKRLSLLSLEAQRNPDGIERYYFLCPPISLWRSATKEYFPNLDFLWEPLNPDMQHNIGHLVVSGEDLGGSVFEPSVMMCHFGLLLSLSTMSTVVISGTQKVTPDGKLLKEYKTTRPIKCRRGFAIIPNYSRWKRREELVYYLGNTLQVLERMNSAEYEAFKEAVLFAVEAEYDEYIKPKFLKLFLSLVILLRAFSDPVKNGRPKCEREIVEDMIDMIQQSGTGRAWKDRAIGTLKNLLRPSEREKIDALLSKYGLEGVLPKEVTSSVRGAIVHAGIFRGDNLEVKVKTCKQLSFGICWLLLRILGYTGCFIHCYKDAFYTEIDAITGEEYSTRE